MAIHCRNSVFVLILTALTVSGSAIQAQEAGTLPPPGPVPTAAVGEAEGVIPATPDTASLLMPAAPETGIPTVYLPTCTFFGSFDYLLLQPQRRALDFAILSSTNDGTPQGSVNSVALKTASGVRVGGGINLPNSNWQFGGYYTYLHSGNSDAIVAPGGGDIYATLTHPGFVSNVNTAAGAANLDYQIVDLEAAQTFVNTEKTTLRFIMGGRFARIDQNISGFYNGQSANSSYVTSPINFYGAGLRFGGDGNWKVFRGFGIYARGAGSLMGGTFRTTLLETNNGGATILTNVTDNYRKIVPVAEMGMGVSWQRNHLRVRLGYEMVNWFGLVDSPDFVHDFSNKLSYRTSDLSLGGLAFQVQLTY